MPSAKKYRVFTIFVISLLTIYIFSKSASAYSDLFAPPVQANNQQIPLRQAAQEFIFLKKDKRFDLLSDAVAATDFTFQTKLFAADGTANSFLGQVVALSGNTAVAAAGNGYYVFVRSGTTWTPQAFLVPSDGIGVVGSAKPVVISGDTIVIGGENATINTNTTQGAVYVFQRSGTNWTEQRLTASDGAADDLFGVSVAISGDTLAIGARRDDIGANANQGSAYIFTRNGTNWSEQLKLTANDGAANAVFGGRVAISGDTLVVGAQQAVVGGNNNQGAAYVFVRSGATWTQQAKIVAGDGTAAPPNNIFPRNLTISGDTIFVGHATATVGGLIGRGKIYLFTRSGTVWTEQPPIIANDGLQDDNFGFSVAVEGNTLVVGAYALNVRPGSAYIFTLQNGVWTQQQKLQISGATISNTFGNSVSISGNTVLVGVPRDTINGNTNQGSAYVYISAAPRQTPFDFDGDSKTDISIFRPSVGEWWLNRSSSGQTVAAQFGNSSDKPVPADFTGDGKTDIAFWRPSSGEWFILRSEDSSFLSFPFGTSGDVPVVGDFDGDGKSDAGVFRPSTNEWFISRSSGGTIITTFGTAGDVPITADYDGDGKSDIAIYRPNFGQWWINRSSNLSVVAAAFGTSTDKPVQGDYSGDGKADIAFFRPSTGEWFILRSEDSSFYSVPFGTSGDIPSPGDYDGDGKFDTAVFRPSNVTWFVNRTTSGVLIAAFGTTGDVPVPSVFVP